MKIYCTQCKQDVEARLTTGEQVYPHRPDLYKMNFWIHDICGNFVGCHKDGSGKRPMGCIATKEIKDARMKIHALLDPLWKHKRIKRQKLYERISKIIGWNYHTSNIRSIEEARTIYRAVLDIKNNLPPQ